MDRKTALVGIGSVLVALCPLSGNAQSSAPAGAPLVRHSAGTPPRFAFLAGPSKSDVAWNVTGDELVQRASLPDPSEQISTALATVLAKRKGGSVVPAGRADFVVEVDTTEWKAGYFVPDRPTNSVSYTAQATISDGSGTVLKTATCDVGPDERSSAGGNDEFVAHGGRTLKTMFSKAADSCLRELVQKTKSV